MTKTKQNGVCPICGKALQMVAKNIRETHMVRNPRERAILNSMATGQPCPIAGCTPHVLHVAKHLKAHTDITVQRIQAELAKAKKAAAIAALASLRASNPQPPMATHLDVEDPGEGSSTFHPQHCQNPGCRRERKEEVAKIKRLKRRIAGLKDCMVAEIERRRAQTTRKTAIAALARLPQPQACRSCRDLKKQIKELKAQVAALEGRLRRNKLALRKLHKDLGRTVLGHQGLIKQKKGLKLVPREDLARCQAMARVKMPSLLEAIEKAPPRDPRRRYRFFGYLAAYLSSIYGHRTGVLTQMHVMEHKTVRKFGTAQLYLEVEEYGWFRTWLRLRNRTVLTNPYFFSSLGRGEVKDIIRYFRWPGWRWS
ncbi:hypothetical protein D5F01_LYC21559 [Larimichthys crocea]|uniref:Uncharacterized protein n=1 Tax=Larimichthys crocea TaxID=215358 RepID=A0A6G0HP59_LARCR|nr:hypothetical protein D5F01_LYC21559 [Larimichthys crocea]